MRSRSTARLRRVIAALVAAPALLAAAGCGGGSADASQSDSSASGSGTPASELRLGYFANVTHGAALIGVSQGYFAKELGSTKLTTQVFNAGPDEVEALFGGALDAAYIGPGPTINAYGQSQGDAIRIIAGAASGGAELVVKNGITKASDLKGKTLASPQLGNTQDVALRAWLTSQGLKNSVTGGGDVTITPTANSDVANVFDSGKIDGAWLPEPYASTLVLGHGAHVLVDEKDLWPGGKFVTTQLVVRTEFLKEHPQTVAALLRGHVEAVQLAQKDPEAAKKAVNAGLASAGGKTVAANVLDRAWSELSVTYDPVSSALQKNNQNGVKAGTQAKLVDLKGIYDLRLLNKILVDEGLTTVSADGLGQQ
ncbi:MAG: ABC transporter substrate-binding protein [Kineosporiaceae bacterium]